MLISDAFVINLTSSVTHLIILFILIRFFERTCSVLDHRTSALFFVFIFIVFVVVIDDCRLVTSSFPFFSVTLSGAILPLLECFGRLDYVGRIYL